MEHGGTEGERYGGKRHAGKLRETSLRVAV
jgi:hypothetical protein